MVLVDNENNVRITRGDSVVFDVDIVDTDGNPYTMRANESIIFTVRKMYGKGNILIQKEASGPVIELLSEDTNLLPFGNYHYDIFLYNEETDMIDTFIAARDFIIESEVHFSDV